MRQICDAADAENATLLNLVVIGSITVVETASALAILERRNAIRKRTAQSAYEQFFEHFENEYQVADITRDILLEAAELALRYPLKAYDAVQLALAVNVKQLLQSDQIELYFASGDRQLLDAAKSEGLHIENPFDYIHLDNLSQQ